MPHPSVEPGTGPEQVVRRFPVGRLRTHPNNIELLTAEPSLKEMRWRFNPLSSGLIARIAVKESVLFRWESL
jgi:hypothetical protein